MEVHVVRVELSAVIYRDPDSERWIAHCLQMDVVAEGDSANAASTTLMELCDMQIEACLAEGDIEGIFRFAPRDAWTRYAMSKEVPPLQPKLDAVQEFKVREYAPAA